MLKDLEKSKLKMTKKIEKLIKQVSWHFFFFCLNINNI